ncbi:MAG: hypothetical protein MI806_21525 [Minwuiales bacterium]|nr:hypothetical protein [Minwuiales bacterium]
MKKLAVPMAVLVSLAFATPVFAGGCGYGHSAQSEQKTVLQTPAPSKPAVPQEVKKPS